MNTNPEFRFACGIISFLCLCIIVLQITLAAKHEMATRSIVTEISVLRTELAKHNEETTGRLSTILTEMSVAHSKFKVINGKNHGISTK